LGDPRLEPKATQKLCALLKSEQIGPLQFAATATASGVAGAGTACSTKVIGVPAVLIDMVDTEDPVEIGSEETYEVKVTNQGSADLNHVKLAFTLPPNEEYISGSGPSDVIKTDSSIATAPLARSPPQRPSHLARCRQSAQTRRRPFPGRSQQRRIPKAHPRRRIDPSVLNLWVQKNLLNPFAENARDRKRQHQAQILE
jgi:uncharacterized repeat protein (TIGR01451 family)